MIPNPEFRNESPIFWAYVRTLSEKLRYTERGQDRVKVPSFSEIEYALTELGLDPTKCVLRNGTPTSLGRKLLGYFAFRSDVLTNTVQHQLMTADEAREVFLSLQRDKTHDVPLPMNKQKAAKRQPAFFTGIVNMLVARGLNGAKCDYSPRQLTTVSRSGSVLRTLSRRLDGAFPAAVNPVAVWEIKEYYYTTTFGSRVADGVYETLLDGMELLDLRKNEGIHVSHYLMVDAYQTWWCQGKSYLCRMMDMLHMGYVDEILFGREAIDRLPALAAEWLELSKEPIIQIR